MADFNNFIPKEPSVECTSSEEDHGSGSSPGTEAQGMAALKQKVVAMERAAKLSDERFKKWKEAEHQVRRLTRENKHYEDVISGQQTKFNSENKMREDRHQSELVGVNEYVCDIRLELASTKRELAKVNQELKTFKTYHEGKMSTLANDYTINLNEQRTRSVEQAKEVKWAHEANNKRMKEGYEASIQQLRQQVSAAQANAGSAAAATHTKELQAVKAQHEKKFQSLSEEYKKSVLKERAESEKKLAQTKLDHDSEMQKMRKKFTEHLQNLSQQNELFRRQLALKGVMVPSPGQMLHMNGAGSPQVPGVPNQNVGKNNVGQNNVGKNIIGQNIAGHNNVSQGKIGLNQSFSASPVQFSGQQVPGMVQTPYLQTGPNTLKRQRSDSDAQGPQNPSVRQRTESYVPAKESPKFSGSASPRVVQSQLNGSAMLKSNSQGPLPSTPQQTPATPNMSTDVQRAQAVLSLPRNEQIATIKNLAKGHAQRMILQGNRVEVANGVLRDEPAAMQWAMGVVFRGLRQTAGLDGFNISAVGAANGDGETGDGLPAPIEQMGWHSVGFPGGHQGQQ
ncbi:unnamed protein product [Periconia digitata]|uniref:Uncharacterized protein n=1 Tax=Periconia digitata TaxID=1303443 RepID=A0A9W4UA38_9PLEO|nr:unnamed protein product [Periconia digitata]